MFPICAPLVPICVTLSTHPISRYFCEDSLMIPPNTPPHFKPLYCYCYPSKNFHRTIPFIFHSCSFVFIRVPFVFTRVPFVFTRVPSCSIRVHSCLFVFTRVHSCSFVFHSCSLVFTRVPFVFHSCSTRVHSCSFVFHLCSLVFIRVHSCSFVFRSVWCFRYDRIKSTGSDIELVVLTLMFDRMTRMRCDKVMISIQLSMSQINWINIESNSNKVIIVSQLNQTE